MGLIEKLIERRIIKTPAVIKAFREIKRQDFLLEEGWSDAESDAPIGIGYGQTNSQPTTVALMLEWLEPQEGDHILDAGCGSGWTTALLANIVGSNGRVYGIELVAELADFARTNISKYSYIDKGIARVVAADAYGGLEEYAPFDKILVSAAAAKIPEELIKELKSGGRMVIPVGPRYGAQEILIVGKNASGVLEEKRMPGFVFVPLVDSAEGKKY